MSNTRFRTALLGSGAAVALMAASVPASADELDQLKGQIEALQSKLETLEQNQVAAQQEQQYVAAPANAVVGGDKPGSFRLPGSNTSVAIGGYAKLDIIYDLDKDIGDSFSAGNVPINTAGPSAANQLDDTFSFSAKQSRLWVKTWTPTDWGEFATHVEFDFEGGEENHLVSNSAKPRLRHAYGQLGNVLAGQTWSNFSTPWAWANTIDFGGTTSTNFLRQPQVRYTAPLGDGMSLAVSIEQPESDGYLCASTVGAAFITCDAPGGSYTPVATIASLGTGNSTDPSPDLVARLQWGADWGTVAVAAVARYLNAVEVGTASTYTGRDDSVFGWGVKAAAVINMPWGKDSVGMEGIYGDGLGRYGLWAVGNAFAQSPGPGFNIQTIEAWGGNAWFEHWWTDSLYSVVLVGYSEIDQPSFAPAGMNTVLASGHANLQWKPTSRTNIGLEAIYGHRQTNGGLNGDLLRLQMGFTWGFST